MNQRLLVPELLDSMDPSDPRAIRSRRDLRLINAFLGNERWIAAQCRCHASSITGITELGAGEGNLSKRLHRALPKATITGLDFRERPAGLPRGIRWITGDFLKTMDHSQADACTGNLILHHFDSESLRILGSRLQEFRLLVFCEPLRKILPMTLARIVLPLAGEVTQHDMPASIRAGFLKGELPSLLGLDSALWDIEEKESGRGSLRLLAFRK
jgi:hypothetical protein